MDTPTRKVFVVEDEPDANEFLSRVLRRFGYDVLSVYDGESALALVSMHKPDLVCLDLSLPAISGYDVLEAIRANGECATIPILVTTGRSTPQDRAMAETLGADEFLTKPFSSEVFMDVVERLMNRDRAVVPIRPEVQQ